ncbi:nuclear mitotic apparatus protein 1 isoform X2 [Ambystoma mexicanum]|uniref:nuclear mitotic apparatus protein 1 isoform X2 n=1 Tax=Ambystoma mexicanum TaxID=8296 RepID=UPI0037E8F613
MSLRTSLAEALTAWVNCFRPAEPIKQLTQLVDGSVLIQVIIKLSGNEEGHRALHLPLPEKFRFISNFISRHCRKGATEECVVDWQALVLGTSSELELAKVVILLLYYSAINNIKLAEIQDLDYKTQAELASILQFIVDNVDHLCLTDNLTNYLQKKVLLPSSCSSLDIDMEEELSPIIHRRREPEVRFLDLHKIASTSFVKNSPSSPINDVFHTPQFKLHRLKTQLTEERALRDELELALSENRKCLTEKEAQIFMMQQRVERLSNLCEKQADQQDPTELVELREKNESLLIRLRDAQKQCQGLKTDKSQNERKIDQLSEENGELLYKVRDTENRLTRTQSELNDISDEYTKTHHEWKLKEKQMESDLSTALDVKRGLEEKILILQGKISLLQDQLEKTAECAMQEKGEVMGDILKLEALKQEVVELKVKVKELQDRIILLEQEKSFLQVELQSEKDKFDKEKQQLDDLITNLQTSLSEMTVQNARLEQEAQAQEQRLTAQINTLENEISKLNASLATKEQDVENLHQQIEEERKLKGQLVLDLQKQEEAAKESIQGLSLQVDNLSNTLRQTEGTLVDVTLKMESEASLKASLTQVHERVLVERDSVVLKFDEYKRAKETELSSLSEQVQNLQALSGAYQVDAEELNKEKAELSQKVQELDSTILALIGKCQNLDAENEAQSKNHGESIESLKSQLIEREKLLKEYKNKLSHKDLLSEENLQLKQKILTTEENIKNLQDLLQNERIKYAQGLEESSKKLSELEAEIQKLTCQRADTQEELAEEKGKLVQLEAQLKQLKESYQDNNRKLQLEISQMSTIITDKEAEREMLVNEASSWRKQCEEVECVVAQRSSQMQDQIKLLKEDHEKVLQQLQVKRARIAELEAQATQATSEQHEKQMQLQSDILTANALLKERACEEEILRSLVQSLQQKLEVDQLSKADVVSQLEADLKKMTEELGHVTRELSEQKLKRMELESTLKRHSEEGSKRIDSLESNLSSALLAVKEKEMAAEKVSSELNLLHVKIEEMQQKHENELTNRDNEIKHLTEEKACTMADLATEKASKNTAFAQLEQSLREQNGKLSALETELSRSVQLVNDKERQLDLLAADTANKQEQLTLQQGTLSVLRAEVATINSLKEQLTKQESEMENYKGATETSVQETKTLKVTISEKEKEIQLLEQNIHQQAQELVSLQGWKQEKLDDISALKSHVNQLEIKCKEQQDCIANLQVDAAKANIVASEKTVAVERQQDQLKALEQNLSCRENEIKQLMEEKDHILLDLAIEKASKLAVEAQLKQSIQEQKDELSTLQNELSRSNQLIHEKEEQLSKLTQQTAANAEELRLKHETVSLLQEEVAAMFGMREQLAKQEREIKASVEATKASTTTINSLKVLISEKEKEIQLLEQNICEQAQKMSTIENLKQEKLNDIAELLSKVSQLESKCKEQHESIANLQSNAAKANLVASESASAAEHQQDRLQALAAEVVHMKEHTSELEGLLESSRVAQSDQENTITTLRREILDKIKELESSNAMADSVKGELSCTHSEMQDLEKVSEGWQAQLNGCRQVIETKTNAISALEQELASYRLRISEAEEERAQLKHLIDEKSVKNQELEKHALMLQSEMAASASETLKRELADLKEHAKQISIVEELKRELAAHKDLKEELNHSVNTWQQKHAEKEEQVSSLQQELASARHFLALITEKNLEFEKQAQLLVLERKSMEDQLKNMGSLQLDLKKASLELAELNSLKDRCSQQELVVRSLQADNASIQLHVCKLEQANRQLLEKNQGLLEEMAQGKKLLDDDLTNLKEQHAQELEELKSELKLDYQKLVGEVRERAHEATKNLEVMTIKYNDAKMKVLDERQKFQEERQKLLSQVELLELSKEEHANQLEELNKKLSHQDRLSKSQQQKLSVCENEFQEEMQHQKKLLSELQTQLHQKEQSSEHYKAQFEKAKIHYDVKKQQIQDLTVELQSKDKVQEQLQKENGDLKADLERTIKELQFTRLQAQDAEQSCKNLTSQVCSLEAQVAFADRQIRERDRFQVSTDTFKSRDTPLAAINTRRHRSNADVSTDSLDLSDDEGIQLNSTRKNGRSHQEASSAAKPGSLDSLTCQRLPLKVESLESLYFTPIPNRVPCKLESSIGSLDELCLDSGRMTRSARRRTTQVINITMIKKTEEQETDSADNSFHSLRSTQSHQNLNHQNSKKMARQPAASVPSLTSLHSQESLGKFSSASSEDNVGQSALMSLPGYKPSTRSSKRLSVAGGNNGATSRNSFYVGAGQDEPDPLEDFNRIAELQQRNRVCPPHLKTSYPLESRTTVASFRITDEEMKTGDPNETLRRGSMLPSQIQAIASHRLTLEPSISSNITTRNKLKRQTEDSHQGPDTPESKKSVICFPRPMTPKEANRRKLSTVDSKKNESHQGNRRESMSFSILNTPRRIGESLLRRGIGKKTPTSKNSPRGSSSNANTTKSQYSTIRNSPLRKSPRVATTKASPRVQNKLFDRKQPKNRKA